MTREEIVKELHKVLNAVDITFPYRLELINAIEYLSNLSFPSNLDEATEEVMPISYGPLEIDCYGGSEPVYSREQMKEMFKAGAQWIAEQGATKEGVITKEYFILFDDDTYIDLDPSMTLNPAFNVKNGYKVIVQIRKK